MPSSSRSKKIALITGAGSGIGRAVVLALSCAGYSVILAGRRVVFLEETAAMVRTGRSRAKVLVAPTDVTDQSSVEALFTKIRDTFGRLDLLFNNACVSAPPVPLEGLTLEQWSSVVDSCLTGAFLCTREAFKLMKTQRPRSGDCLHCEPSS